MRRARRAVCVARARVCLYWSGQPARPEWPSSRLRRRAGCGHKLTPLPAEGKPGPTTAGRRPTDGSVPRVTSAHRGGGGGGGGGALIYPTEARTAVAAVASIPMLRLHPTTANSQNSTTPLSRHQECSA